MVRLTKAGSFALDKVRRVERINPVAKALVLAKRKAGAYRTKKGKGSYDRKQQKRVDFSENISQKETESN